MTYIFFTPSFLNNLNDISETDLNSDNIIKLYLPGTCGVRADQITSESNLGRIRRRKLLCLVLATPNAGRSSSFHISP
jgi:hypothetical protein